MRRVIVDSTGTVLVVDPPTDKEGNTILPEGLGAREVTLSDEEAEKLSIPDSRFRVSGVTVNVQPVPPVEDPRSADLALVRDPDGPVVARLDALVRVLGLSAG